MVVRPEVHIAEAGYRAAEAVPEVAAEAEGPEAAEGGADLAI